MPQLDNYLVSLGLKGQNAVLSVMDKIRKKGGDLSKKKTVVTVTTKTKPAKLSGGTLAPPGTPGTEPGTPIPPRPGFPGTPPEDRNNKKFLQATERFSDGVKNFTSAAASLDPTSTMTSLISSVGTALSGISIFGFGVGQLPAGVAALINNGITMASNAVSMARQSIAAFHQLTTRNAAANHYGENISRTGPMSRNERAMFIDVVSGSMGRIQGPLADAINRLVGTKDTRALSRVAAGDWESTGTDTGWMLGQISSSFQGLPPSVRQRLQASLLQNFAGEIQNMAPNQAATQEQAATWANMEENQISRLAEQAHRAQPLAQQLNDMQVSLYDTGIGCANAVSSVTQTINDLAAAIPRVTNAFKAFIADPSLHNAKLLMQSVEMRSR